jgi:AraC family transcriptional regulator
MTGFSRSLRTQREKNMMARATLEIGELSLAQADGASPTTLADGSAPGESGVFVMSARFQGGLHLSGTPRSHHICFQTSAQARFDCRIGERALSHSRSAGSLAICPAGIGCAAHANESVEGILVSVDPAQFALVAAEDFAPDAQLVERLSGYDQALFDLARRLAAEGADGYPNGPLFWNDTASAFVDGLVARHASKAESRSRAQFSKHVLARVKDYVLTHLDERIEVAALANIAGHSPFHFTRVFARSFGMTPHRYVVHLRLLRAVELVRDGRSGLAEIAARTGFADQSHLSRWIRRVHGVSPSELAT